VKIPLVISRRKCEDNIKRCFNEIASKGVEWIQLAQDRVHWRAFVNTVMNTGFTKGKKLFDHLKKDSVSCG
jgi:hypothetical protein